MAKMPEMDADFARWYAEAFMDEGKIREARWKGVVETAAAADFIMVEILVRYAFATTAPADGGKNETLEKKHQEVLGTISGGSVPLDPVMSHRELQVLSAAVLARLFTTLPDAAIAVLNASFGRVRTIDLPMDLPGLAKRALAHLSKLKHVRPNQKEFEIIVPKVNFQASPEALANMSPTQWKIELDRLRDAAQSTVRTVVEGHNRIAKLMVDQMSLAEEELQMLWWLIGAYSDIVHLPFNEISGVIKPLVFGKELGQLTEVSPGPASVRALLLRAGVADDALTVSDVVNAADLDWIREITKSPRVSPVTTPLHFALEKRADVGSNDTWIPVWASMTGLPATSLMSAVALAELFYREHLFLHVVG